MDTCDAAMEDESEGGMSINPCCMSIWMVLYGVVVVQC